QSSNAEQIADEGITGAVPGEQDGTARQLALGFRNGVHGITAEADFSLEDSVAPVDAQEIDGAGSAQTDGCRGQALSRPGGGAQRLLADPAAIDARRQTRA